MTIKYEFDRHSQVHTSRRFVVPLLRVADHVSVAVRGEWKKAGLTGAKLAEPKFNEAIFVQSYVCGGWAKPAQVRLGAGIRKEDVEEVLGRKLIKPEEAESTTKRGAWVPKNGWLLG